MITNHMNKTIIIILFNDFDFTDFTGMFSWAMRIYVQWFSGSGEPSVAVFWMKQMRLMTQWWHCAFTASTSPALLFKKFWTSDRFATTTIRAPSSWIRRDATPDISVPWCTCPFCRAMQFRWLIQSKYLVLAVLRSSLPSGSTAKSLSWEMKLLQLQLIFASLWFLNPTILNS